MKLAKADCGKEKQTATPAIINENDFDKDIVEIFTFDKEHSLNRVYFANWIRTIASHWHHLYLEPSIRICIVIDNSTWYNRLCDEPTPFKRS